MSDNIDTQLDEILHGLAKRIENMPRGKTYGWEDEKASIKQLYDPKKFIKGRERIHYNYEGIKGGTCISVSRLTIESWNDEPPYSRTPNNCVPQTDTPNLPAKVVQDSGTSDDISLCPHCHSMTHTIINGNVFNDNTTKTCGKCYGFKDGTSDKPYYKHAECDKAIVEERLDDACEGCRAGMYGLPPATQDNDEFKYDLVQIAYDCYMTGASDTREERKQAPWKQHAAQLERLFERFSLGRVKSDLKKLKLQIRGEGEPGNAGEMVSVNYLDELIDETVAALEKEGS